MTTRKRRPDGEFGPETIARMSLRDLLILGGVIISAVVGGIAYVEGREDRLRLHWKEDLDMSLKPIVDRLQRLETHEDSWWGDARGSASK